jgi:hypothetical protein
MSKTILCYLSSIFVDKVLILSQMNPRHYRNLQLWPFDQLYLLIGASWCVSSRTFLYYFLKIDPREAAASFRSSYYSSSDHLRTFWNVTQFEWDSWLNLDPLSSYCGFSVLNPSEMFQFWIFLSRKQVDSVCSVNGSLLNHKNCDAVLWRHPCAELIGLDPINLEVMHTLGGGYIDIIQICFADL